MIDDIAYEKFLTEHGCKLLKKEPTGRTVLIGKMLATEYVYVYECADGIRTEVHP